MPAIPVGGQPAPATGRALERVVAEGRKVLRGGGRAKLPGKLAQGHFVVPAVVEARSDYPAVQEDTSAPILYVIPIDDLEDAIASADTQNRPVVDT